MTFRIQCEFFFYFRVGNEKKFFLSTEFQWIKKVCLHLDLNSETLRCIKHEINIQKKSWLTLNVDDAAAVRCCWRCNESRGLIYSVCIEERNRRNLSVSTFQSFSAPTASSPPSTYLNQLRKRFAKSFSFSSHAAQSPQSQNSVDVEEFEISQEYKKKNFKHFEG
jgi:hypothetical protein